MFGEHMVNMNGEHLVNMGGEHWVNNGEHRVNNGEHIGEHYGEHIGEHLAYQSKHDFINSLTNEDLAEELLRRINAGEIKGGGLEGVEVAGGVLQLFFKQVPKREWKKTTFKLYTSWLR